jgi:hypothetical protein
MEYKIDARGNLSVFLRAVGRDADIARSMMVDIMETLEGIAVMHTVSMTVTSPKSHPGMTGVRWLATISEDAISDVAQMLQHIHDDLFDTEES